MTGSGSARALDAPFITMVKLSDNQMLSFYMCVCV